MGLTSVVEANSVSAVSDSKTKTKAKKRYLKAKKERRKQRKTGTSTVVVTSRNEVESDVSEHEESPKGEAVEPEQTRPPRVEKEKRRPKKRPRVDEVPEDEDGEVQGDTKRDDEDPMQIENDESIPDVVDRVPPAVDVALPSFPLPTRPNAPSKSDLALQGQDKALIKADFVDSQKVTTISLLSDTSSVTLSEKTQKRLQDLGITELFAVQTAVIPFLLSSSSQRALYLPYNPPRDLCVSAPTGSGKTLAYVLPIIEVLASRVVTRLRALIVLPTRDLVTQVRETFEELAKGRGLKIGTATGQHSFAHEQAQLVADRFSPLQGGSSKVDILICTPGRLIDHLNGTPNFSLQHLRYLVIDEADRLLAQSFQDWLAQVLAATRPSPAIDISNSTASESHPARPKIPTPDGLAPAFLRLLRDVPSVQTDLDEKQVSSCQKLLFSATLTRDPSKIAALNLQDPKYIVVQTSDSSADDGILNVVMEKFTMPATLKEHMIICETSQKPLILFHLIHAHGVRNAIVFTKSAESTTRLVRLFEFFEAARIGSDQSGSSAVTLRAYSSDLGAGERKSILDQFKNQEIHILVCSDLISRGIDISHVSHVVSYDAPVDMRKYVHRVGRTARAGRDGHAWTLVEEQEARYFKTILREADHLDSVKRMKVSDKDLSTLTPHYEVALEKLKGLYARS